MGVNCLVHQTQNVRLQSPNVLLVVTSNRMEGVPFAEGFTVDTKWIITEENEKCRLQVWVKVNFTRNVSLVRGRIERNSIQGTVDYFKTYAKFLRSKFTGGQQGGGGNASDKPVAVDSGAAKSSDKFVILSVVFGICFVFFFLLWLWYWWSMASLREENFQLKELGNELENRKPPMPVDVQEKIAEWKIQVDALIVTAQKLSNEL